MSWQDDPTPLDTEVEEELEEEEEELFDEESEISSEEEWTPDMFRRNIPLWCRPSKLPQDVHSEEDSPGEPDALSSTADEEDPPKPRKPPKKFFEDPKFFSHNNRPVLPTEEWDEDENLDNIETLMKQTSERNELDATAMQGVLTNIVPNYGFDDINYKDFSRKPSSSVDSNFDMILSSSDEEKITPVKNDHYKELILADNQIIDCRMGRKVCDKMYPTKYYGLPKILERKEKIRSQKPTSGTMKGNLSSFMTVMASSGGDISTFCQSGSVRRKGWKLKEPFPKKDSIQKNMSSSSTMELGSESDKKLDESRPGPAKVYPKCKWFDECIFKILFKLAVKREKKISTIKTDLDFEIDEILDDLFMMSREAKNHLIPRLTDDFTRYKNEFIRTFDQERKEKKEVDTEEIKLWPNHSAMEIVDVGAEMEEPCKTCQTTQQVRQVSSRLYQKIPRSQTPRARIEKELAAERALDVKKKRNIIQKKFKPIEINPEALPQAMELYYKEKEEHKRKKDRDSKPKDDDGAVVKKKHEEKVDDKGLKSTGSLHPSYTKLIPPYSNVCKERIRKTLKKYRKAFSEELQSLADQENFALAGVALKRMFVITIGKGHPPVEMSYKQQARLYKLLES